MSDFPNLDNVDVYRYDNTLDYSRFKPTARRVPTEGALPLSTSHDSIGPFAPDVASATIIDAILAGETPAPP